MSAHPLPLGAPHAIAGRPMKLMPRTWHEPTPNPAVMRVLGIVNRWFLLQGLPLLRRIPFVRDLPLVHGYFWVRRVDLAAADRATLERAVNSGTCAFLAPNHPEFGTDWLIDKEVSTWVAPRIASWAASGIVNAAPRFWGMNNLVANDGGDAAMEYSIRRALAGEGVLLHPEGIVRWTNDVVHPLYPGVARMAMKAAERTDKPVYVVPIVWKYQFVGDVSRRIHREMRLIERALRLPSLNGTTITWRFRALQENVLAVRMRRFGYEEQSPTNDFFTRQRAFQEHLIAVLEARHRVDAAESVDKTIARLTREIRNKLSATSDAASPAAALKAEALREDLAMAEEAKRLGEFSREVYGAPTLTQEHVFECLKRMRDRLMRRGWRSMLANMMPRPFGPRVVHVGVPTPILVTRVKRHEWDEYEATVLELARASMQATLDEINAGIAPHVRQYAHANPFSS